MDLSLQDLFPKTFDYVPSFVLVNLLEQKVNEVQFNNRKHLMRPDATLQTLAMKISFLGGIVSWRPGNNYTEHIPIVCFTPDIKFNSVAFRAWQQEETISNRERDAFHEKFFDDIFDRRQIVDLKDYLIGQSIFEPYDGNQILSKEHNWKKLKLLRPSNGDVYQKSHFQSKQQIRKSKILSLLSSPERPLSPPRNCGSSISSFRSSPPNRRRIVPNRFDQDMHESVIRPTISPIIPSREDTSPFGTIPRLSENPSVPRRSALDPTTVYQSLYSIRCVQRASTPIRDPPGNAPVTSSPDTSPILPNKSIPDRILRSIPSPPKYFPMFRQQTRNSVGEPSGQSSISFLDERKLLDYVIRHNEYDRLGSKNLYFDMVHKRVLANEQSWETLMDYFRKTLLRRHIIAKHKFGPVVMANFRKHLTD